MLGLVKPMVVMPLRADGNYPHMAHRDRAVWARWLALYADQYLGVVYDLAFGGLDAPDPEATRTEREMWQYQTALKIDAFVLAPDRALVIEVRPWATVSALGAALTYAMGLQEIGVTESLLVPTIVCEGIQVDVAAMCAKLGIDVVQV